MHFDISSALWIDPLVIAFIVAAVWVVLRDLASPFTRRHRTAKERESRLDQMLDDWTGALARPGVEERPGVMTRLMTIEKHMAVLDKEMTFNSGSSTKDAVYRIDRTVQGLLRSVPEQHIHINSGGE